MAKIVKSITLALEATTIDNILKYKAPGKKADEQATTVFGDTAKKREPHPLADYDGASFETQDPAAMTNAGTKGTIVVVKTYTDNTTETHTFEGWWDCEATELDVEGNTVDGYSCPLHVDGANVIT